MARIFEWGVIPTISDHEKQCIKIANKVALVVAIIGSFYLLFALIFAPVLAKASVGMVAGSLLVLYLNKLQLTNFSRFFLALSTSVTVAFYHALLVMPGDPLILHLYIAQFVVILLPWVYIDLRTPGLLAASVGISLIVFLFQPWLNNAVPSNIDASWITNPVMTYVTYFFDLIAIVICLNLLQSRSVAADRQADKLRDAISEKTSEMERRQKELQESINEINESYAAEENRSWIATGLSKMTDLMRRSKAEELFPALIEAVVKYMEIVQGAIYMVEEDDHSGEKMLQLEGCFAFDRRKFIERKIPVSDGALGQSYMEKETIKLYNLPRHFVDITSGLGDEPPNNIIIVPLVYEGEVWGVMELIAYNPFNTHEEEFLHQLGENIASFISNHLVNLKTQELLAQSQEQAEEMRAQEEEMRQNMEELQATQEEMGRKENEYIQRIKELEEKLEAKQKSINVDK